MRDLLRLLRSAQQLRPYYLGIAFTSVLTAATALVVPFLVKAATDVVVAQAGSSPGSTEEAVRRIVWIALALLAVDITHSLITNVGGYLGDVMSSRLRAIMSQRYFDHLLSLPQSYFDDEMTGTIINRLNRSITETSHFLQVFANSFCPMLLTVVAVVGISGYYAWPLALLLLILFPVFMWLTTLTSSRWQKLEGEKNAVVDEAGGRFAEVVGQIKVVRSFRQENRELTRFERAFAATVGLTRTQSRYWHVMDASRHGAVNLIFFGIYAVIFVRTVQGAFTLGVMVLLIQLVNMARQPVMMMSYLVDTGQRALAGTRSYFEVMDLPPDRAELPAFGPASPPVLTTTAPVSAAAPGTPAAPAISFEGVCFGYGDEADVLRDITFSVRAGERVALVGESGGGKSTLVSLLLGFYRPQAGRILVGDDEVASSAPQVIRDQVGVVFQDPSLFSGSIRENIAYGRPGATEEEVLAAARRAHAHVFVESFRDGYDTVIGERGLKLSGGQKQRIAVARAIMKDAPVLVLDEATSSLDGRSERLVQAGLDSLMTGRTTIIIAHRLATISSVDRIVTLRDGRVDEFGTPAELAASGGIYAELLALQAKSSKRDRKRLAAYDITG
ncbi:ATP-binding cassette, subfamily B [Austwickia chelonae]|uniref:Putative ABC transporter ATP-binding/permease protein n=1 Tax=Austwickia chelonae NBRC 105200 TaxID=1184607 RepID=K6VAR6_9MICO|nr:ABC transporter ATP-binding protein [Austwickia chelonae]GAB79343.1 putative ABC transporter ATP-binding/permease protein [Austwickia chelonae NBRC 105200]SEW44048.1 ATP-binding cassette, subfamily B [Austwickia chelonae]